MNINLVVLYVEDVARAQAFYEKRLGRPPLDASPGFAMFEAGPSLRLGLWKASSANPQAKAPGGGELCVLVEEGEVEPMARAWEAEGVQLALPPTRLVFGFGFVALDPDGHRLRVFAPA